MQRTFSHSSVGGCRPSSQPHLQAAPWFVVPPSATRPDVRSPAFRRPSLVLLRPERLQPAVICAETERPFPVLHMIRPKAANLFLLSLAAMPPHPTNPPPVRSGQQVTNSHLAFPPSATLPDAFVPPSGGFSSVTQDKNHETHEKQSRYGTEARRGNRPRRLALLALRESVFRSFPDHQAHGSCHCRLGSAPSYDVPCSFPSRQTIPRTPLSCHCRLGSALSHDVPCPFPLP